MLGSIISGICRCFYQRTTTVFAIRNGTVVNCTRKLSSYSNVESTPPRYREGRSVLTLRPDRMQELGQQTYDISGLKSALFNPISHMGFDEESIREYTNIVYRNKLHEDELHGTYKRFPPGTKGLLYYHHNGDPSDISGEVRFRICSSPSRFSEGRDLRMSVAHISSFEGPWSIPLYSIASYPNYGSLQQLLLAEELVDRSLLNDLSQLPHRKHLLKIILYDMEYPFILDLSLHKPRLYVMTRTKVKMIYLPYILSDSDEGRRFQPYEGLVRCQLVRSTNTAKFHLKFLELLTPVRCVIPNYSHRIRQPQVGECLTRVYGKGKPKLWTYTDKEDGGL